MPQEAGAQSEIFSLVATDGAARAGVIRTAHGEIPTPAFMPVGTKATVKSLHPDEVRALGAYVILGNTYHLHLRPGEDVIAELGGLHASAAGTARSSPTRAASRSSRCATRWLAVDDDGVTFRSVYDGAAERLTPESAAAIQRASAPTSPCASTSARPPARRARELEQAVRRTTIWAERQAEADRARPDSSASASRRAAPTPSSADGPIEEISALPFDGFALGGLAVGESRDEMLDAVGWAAPLLPEPSPRYFMGIGDAEGILEVIARGVDMFDCVLPTRTARTGGALTAGPAASTSATPASPATRGRSRRAATARPASASRARTSGTS